jgi:hypothetical protein
MKLIDATRSFGSVGILLPLILIFLIAADAAHACPGTQTRVVYRTRTLNSRTVPVMGTTVITYGGTPSARCGDNMYRTQSVRYVAARRNSYYTSGRTYVMSRTSDDYYPVRRVRYMALRNIDYDDAPRYVAVRRQPTYVESRARYIAVRNGDLDDASRYVPVGRYSDNAGIVTRYAAVRSGYRTGNGIVGYVDVNDAPRYVAVRRQPVYDSGTRYVTVRNIDNDYDNEIAPTRYVAVRNVRNACACADQLRSSLDDVETVSPRHVVVKSDYLAGTQEVIVPNTSYDDTAYVAVPSDSVNTTNVGYSNVAYYDDSETYTPASYAVIPRARTITYVPANNDNDFDDRANLDTDNVTYVADNDIGDACLSSVAIQASMGLRRRAVNYVPADDVDYDASLTGSGTKYVANEIPASTARYVPVIADDDDADMTNVADSDVADSCSCPVALRTGEDDLGAQTVSYVPVNDVGGYGETVSYVPVNVTQMRTVRYVPVEDTDTMTVNNVPADETDNETVSDMPADSVDNVDTAAVTPDDSSMPASNVESGPVAVDENSTALVNESDSSVAADLVATQQAAGQVGYRDGLADGRNAAMNLQENRPGETENFQTATNGYGDAIGDMDIYKDAYRSSYLEGFSEGYNSSLASS